MSTTIINEGTNWCHDGITVENSTLCQKPLTLLSPCPVGNHRECMFMPPVMEHPVTRRQAIKDRAADADAPTHLDEKNDKYHHPTVEEDTENTNTDTFIESACRDKWSDCSTVNNSEDDKTDANASLASREWGQKIVHGDRLQQLRVKLHQELRRPCE